LARFLQVGIGEFGSIFGEHSYDIYAERAGSQTCDSKRREEREEKRFDQKGIFNCQLHDFP
jgi:hypothetical protein